MYRLFASSLLLAASLTSPSFAAPDLLSGATDLCKALMAGTIVQDQHFSKSDEKPKNPFGETAYEGSWNELPVIVAAGEKFGDALCDVQFPSATAADYVAVNAELNKALGGTGTVYDKPDGAFGYRGEIWADKDAMDGSVEDLTVGEMPLSSIFVQYADEGFRQTAGRTGLIIEMQGR